MMKKIMLFIIALVLATAAYSQTGVKWPPGGSNAAADQGRSSSGTTVSVLFSDGKLDEYTTSEWDPFCSRVNSQARYPDSGVMWEQIEFSYSNGIFTTAKTTRDAENRLKNRVEYQYNPHGQILRETIVDNKGKASNGEMFFSETKGSVTKANSSTRYQYDDRGNLVRQEVFDGNGNITTTVNTVWQNGHKVKNRKNGANGSIQRREIYEYGANGEFTPKTVVDFEGESTQTMQYEYTFRPVSR
ncbi:MAG: hypothetical protein LBD18_03695 [Treponema sp.]|jgi:YD repeat-containing protein|nr:hypothetical protein [Treponema sp.]